LEGAQCRQVGRFVNFVHQSKDEGFELPLPFSLLVLNERVTANVVTKPYGQNRAQDLDDRLDDGNPYGYPGQIWMDVAYEITNILCPLLGVLLGWLIGLRKRGRYY